MNYNFFENSIALFESSYFMFMDESRIAFLNPNPHCVTAGTTMKQRNIELIQ